MKFWCWILSIFLLCQLPSTTEALAIDNGVVGDPQVQCSEDSVTFSVRTQDRFTGNMYIKGKFSVPQCRQEYFSNTFNGASFTVKIGECGMQRIRQLQPTGMNYILVFVVNFHNQFITKVDRAYNVRCFYAQVDKTVTSQLEVSMLATTELAAQTMLMPNCQYTVRSGTLNGPIVRYARVGDRLVHRWECDNPNYGMLVKNCFVNDGQGSSVRVLDARGCPVFTPVIQGQLNYDNSLNLAYVEVWAYKFPDQNNLFFQCQISLCGKRENECIGVTPPNCPLVPKSEFVGSSIDTGTTDEFGRVNVRINPNQGITGFNQGGYPQTGTGFGPVAGFGGSNTYQPYGTGSGTGTGSLSFGNGVFGGGSATGNFDPNFGSSGQPFGLQGFQPARPYAARDQPRPATIDEQPVMMMNNNNSFSQLLLNDSGVNSSGAAAAAARAKKSAFVINGIGRPSRSLSEPSDDSDNHTMDIASETMFVVDLQETQKRSGDSASHSDDGSVPFSPFADLDDDTRLVCLNPISLGLILSSLGVLVMLVVSLLVFLVHSKKEKVAGGQNNNNSGGWLRQF